jgi:hypothetical protein
VTCPVCKSLGYACTQHRVALGKEVETAVAAERARIADMIQERKTAMGGASMRCDTEADARDYYLAFRELQELENEVRNG